MGLSATPEGTEKKTLFFRDGKLAKTIHRIKASKVLFRLFYNLRRGIKSSLY